MLKRVWGQTATTGRFTGLCCWQGERSQQKDCTQTDGSLRGVGWEEQGTPGGTNKTNMKAGCHSYMCDPRDRINSWHGLIKEQQVGE